MVHQKTNQFAYKLYMILLFQFFVYIMSENNYSASPLYFLKIVI